MILFFFYYFSNIAQIIAFYLINSGGESGIRTHGTCEGTHTFQACALNRSAISPINLFSLYIKKQIVENSSF
tara:strand:+ start:995 stop:1210 length:216 start_codon:yes stop_codon:yes gene_type:complete